jgi:hypothetical protein
MYVVLGYNHEDHKNLKTIWRIDLTVPVTWEELDYSEVDLNIFRSNFGHFSQKGTLYMFGGYTLSGFKNDLAVLNLGKHYIDEDKLAWKILSKDMNVPTPRLGHAMDIYDGNIYIFGGKGKEGKK